MASLGACGIFLIYSLILKPVVLRLYVCRSSSFVRSVFDDMLLFLVESVNSIYSEPSLERQYLFPKYVAIKMNQLLYKILNKQIDM